nr:phospholipase-like, aminotransferase-like mobile domain protein [Tanacetum cinerariifolium]
LIPSEEDGEKEFSSSVPSQQNAEDHINWLLQHGWHEKALAAVEARQGRSELLDEITECHKESICGTMTNILFDVVVLPLPKSTVIVGLMTMVVPTHMEKKRHALANVTNQRPQNGSNLFNKEAGKQLEECKLMVIYIARKEKDKSDDDVKQTSDLSFEYPAKIHVRRKLHYLPLIKDRLNEARRSLFCRTCFRPWLDITNGDILFRNRLFSEKIGNDFKIVDVLALIENEEMFSKVNDEDAIRLCLLLSLEVIFMGRELVSVVDGALLRMVDNLDAWNTFPLGEHIWRQLYNSIRNVSSKH